MRRPPLQLLLPLLRIRQIPAVVAPSAAAAPAAPAVVAPADAAAPATAADPAVVANSEPGCS
jgi:hypothetical protein